MSRCVLRSLYREHTALTLCQQDVHGVPPSLTEQVSSMDLVNQLGMTCYEVRSVPGKGKGLVARVNIPIGTRIIAEKPLFTAMSSVDVLDAVILSKVGSLSKEQQRQYLSLHNNNNHSGEKPFPGIYKTNALPCSSNSPIGAVYPTICLTNPSCLSNSHNNWNSAINMETIHASRDIKAGEEITISYVEDIPYEQRLTKLKSAFGFKCDCELCSLPASALEESDNRRIEIARLDQAIGGPTRTMNSPHLTIADCKQLLNLLKQEHGNCPSPEARAYYDAFQISSIHSDQARASVFAQKAYEARLVCEGEDSPETVRMKSLMEDPKKHQSFGVSKRWRTGVSGAPKGLGESEFEEWFWGRGKK